MSFFTPAQAAELERTGCHKAELVEFRFASETVRLWNGNGDLQSGGRLWKGLGGLGSIDGLEQTRGPESHQVTFTLSGVDDSIMSKAIAETPEVEGRIVVVSMQLFTSEWQVIGGPIAIWFGLMFPPKVTRTPAQGVQGGSRTVQLPAENLFMGRSRPAAGRYTDRDQQTRFSGDRFFEYVPTLMTKSISWPNFSGQ